MTLFENPSALPRAFVPRRVRAEPDAGKTLEAMGRTSNFSEIAWISAPAGGEIENPPAQLSVRSVGPDLLVRASCDRKVFVATSLPDWPGWSARSGNESFSIVTTNHAFVGFWLPPGRRTVRLSYRPPSWNASLALFGAGILLSAGIALSGRRNTV